MSNKTTDLQTECSNDAEQLKTYKLVNRLFAAFAGIYGDKWAKQFDSESMHQNAILQWSIALRNYTEQELGLGVDRCRNEYNKYNTLPSIARFKFLAKGLIESDKAFELALRGDYKMKAIKSAIYRIGEKAFKKLSAKRAKERFIHIYGLICDDIVAGNEVLVPAEYVQIDRKQSNEEWIIWVKRHLGDDAYNIVKKQLILYNQNKSLYIEQASNHGLANYAKMIAGGTL